MERGRMRAPTPPAAGIPSPAAAAAPRPQPPLPGPRAAPGDGGRAPAGGGRRAAEPSGRGGERGCGSGLGVLCAGEGRSAGQERRGSLLSVASPRALTAQRPEVPSSLRAARCRRGAVPRARLDALGRGRTFGRAVGAPKKCRRSGCRSLLFSASTARIRTPNAVASFVDAWFSVVLPRESGTGKRPDSPPCSRYGSGSAASRWRRLGQKVRSAIGDLFSGSWRVGEVGGGGEVELCKSAEL